jgi:hypothetical protein
MKSWLDRGSDIFTVVSVLASHTMHYALCNIAKVMKFCIVSLDSVLMRYIVNKCGLGFIRFKMLKTKNNVLVENVVVMPA